MIISLIVIHIFGDDASADANEICKIPKLDPWDASILKYLKTKPEKIRCPSAFNIMFVNESGFIQYNRSALNYYSLQSKHLKCNYQTLKRILGDKQVKFRSKKGFAPPAFINSTYFRVSCTTGEKLVYDFLHFNPFWIEDKSRDSEIGAETDDHYSILLIGIDSVSRSHALRDLPKSYKYLTEVLGAVDFKGYMKVGSNTFPNLIPLLTGMRHRSFPLVNSRVSYCDSMSLLWKEKSLRRYASLYSEDRSDISTFNFVKPGFYRSPTDFYYRPYNMAMNLFTPVIMNPIDTMNKNCPWQCPCYANTDNFTVQVNHFKGFLSRYKGKLKFTFFWGNAAHESFGLLQQSDDTLMELLKWMRTNGHLERAVVAVLSDHGLRLGEFAETYIGRLEGHFPFISVIVPEKLKEKYAWIERNLLLNSHKITTHFDTHKTIIDIANGHIEDTAPPVANDLIARNIFSFIPKERTCADAGIPPNFCTCEGGGKVLSIDNKLLKPLALYAVSQLNSALANHTDICRHLTLFKITEARVQYTCSKPGRNNYKPGIGLLDSFLTFILGYDSNDCGNSGRYKLLFQTLPSKGIFEVMVEYNEGTKDGQKSKMSLVGDIARIDRYGEQSHCIKQNALLRQYCYCKDIG